MKESNNFLMNSRIFLSVSCAVGILSLTGCLNDIDEPEPVEVAAVGIYHASPNTNALDIVVGNNGAINSEPFSYGDYSGYLNFYPGDRSIRFTEHLNGAVAIVDTTVTFVGNKYYSIFLAGSLPNVEALVLVDSADTPASGKAMLRVIHLSPDAGALSVSVDGENTFSDISFMEGSVFKQINAGTLDFQLISQDEDEVLLNIPQREIKSGKYVSLLIKGFNEPPSGNTHGLSTDFIKH